MSVIASHWSTIQPGFRSSTSSRTWSAKMPALAKNSGASQRNTTTPAMLDEVVGRPTGRCASLAPDDPAEHLAVRPPVAVEEQQDRQHDGDDDALEHAEEDDAERWPPRRRATADRRTFHTRAQGPEVDERERGRDHHGGQRRVRQVGEQPVERDEQQHDDAGADDAGELALGPATARRRPCASCWTTRRTRGRQPAARLAEPMPIISWFGRTRSPRLGVERRRQRDRVGQRDERDADGGDEQRARRRRGRSTARAGVGSPFGRVPTVAMSRSNTAVTTVAPTTATSTAGTVASRAAGSAAPPA